MQEKEAKNTHGKMTLLDCSKKLQATARKSQQRTEGATQTPLSLKSKVAAHFWMAGAYIEGAAERRPESPSSFLLPAGLG